MFMFVFFCISLYRNSSKPRAGYGGRVRQVCPSPVSFPKQASTDDALTPNPIPATLLNVSLPVVLVNWPTGCLTKRRNRVPIHFPHTVSSPGIAAATPAPSTQERSSPKLKAKTDHVPVSPSRGMRGIASQLRARNPSSRAFNAIMMQVGFRSATTLILTLSTQAHRFACVECQYQCCQWCRGSKCRFDIYHVHWL